MRADGLNEYPQFKLFSEVFIHQSLILPYFFIPSF